jgi:hypothetical protein
MLIFSFAWIPFFYLFWRSLLSPGVTGDKKLRGGLGAFLAGSLVALLRFFLNAFIDASGFGLSRWLSACVDIIGLPALLALFFYAVAALASRGRGSRSGPNSRDFALFALPYFIPLTLLHTLNQNTGGGPLTLLLPPLLWTAFAGGASLFIGFLRTSLVLGIVSILCIFALFLLLPTVWWAFYSQKTFLAAALLAAAFLPLLINIVIKLCTVKSGVIPPVKPVTNTTVKEASVYV